jgi:hypothetical protein
MKPNIFMFMVDRFILFIRLHVVTAFILIICIFVPALTLHIYNGYAFDNANVVRDTQFLLSLNGSYTGPIDGQCNAQTKQAIAQYQNRLANAPPSVSRDIDCNVELLNTIRNDISTALTTTNATVPSKEIDEIKTSLKNTNAALKGLTDGFASNFLSQYNSLASSGLSAFIAALFGTIAIIALASTLLKDFIKEYINTHTQAVLDKATDHLLTTANIEHASLATQIYARLGGRILLSQLNNFYRDPMCPQVHRRERYMGYLEGGAHISTVGNDSANKLIRLYREKKIPIPDDDAKWINACKNNFIFYVSAKHDTYFNISKSEDVIKTVGDVANAIKELEAMLSDNRKTLSLVDNRETLIWAKLCLGIMTGQVAKTQIELLASDSNINDEWKKEVQERYEFYDRFPEHAGNKVNLAIA